MVGISALLVAGGIAYTGSVALRQLRNSQQRFQWLTGRTDVQKISVQEHITTETDEAKATAAMTKANRSLAVSSLSLGVTTTALFLNPMLLFVSVPVLVVLVAPTLHSAWQTVRQERRVTPAVLDATRISLCVIMGYYFALALDTWLRTLAQRLLMRSDLEFQAAVNTHLHKSPDTVWTFIAGSDVQLPVAELRAHDVISLVAGDLIPAHGVVLYGDGWVDELLMGGQTTAVHKQPGDAVAAATQLLSGQLYVQVTEVPATTMITDTLRDRLESMVTAGSYGETIAKRSGRTMAPNILLGFGLLLPFWDPNRAGGLLTMSLGSQMNALGPQALQNFANLALQQNLLILDGRALETLNLVNTVIIDITLLRDPALRAQVSNLVHALRRRTWPAAQVARHNFAIYLLTDGDELEAKRIATQTGLDDYFVEPSTTGRVSLLERLQIGGRLVCYVGDGTEDHALTKKVLVTIAIPAAMAAMDASQPQAANAVIDRLESTSAQVVLLEKNLDKLPQLFTIAAQFGFSEGYNLAWPLFMDLLDLSTTVFIHLGLTYSVIFSNTGLLLSAVNSRQALVQYRRQQQAAQYTTTPQPITPERQLAPPSVTPTV